MKSLLCILISLAILFIGCSSTYHINPKSSDNSLAKMNKKLEGKRARLFLLNGQEIAGKDIQIRSDSTSWVEPDGEEYKSIATSEVQQIIQNDRGRGAFKGGIIGVLVFTPPCMLLGAAVGGNSEGQSTVKEGAIGGGLIGLCAGIVFGAPIEAAVGSKEKYIFTTVIDSL